MTKSGRDNQHAKQKEGMENYPEKFRNHPSTSTQKQYTTNTDDNVHQLLYNVKFTFKQPIAPAEHSHASGLTKLASFGEIKFSINDPKAGKVR